MNEDRSYKPGKFINNIRDISAYAQNIRNSF